MLKLTTSLLINGRYALRSLRYINEISSIFFSFFYRTIIDYHVTSIILKFVVIKRSLRVKSILCAIKSEILKMPYIGKYSRTEVFFIDFKWMPKLSVQLNIYFPVIFTYNIHNRVFFFNVRKFSCSNRSLCVWINSLHAFIVLLNLQWHRRIGLPT